MDDASERQHKQEAIAVCRPEVPTADLEIEISHDVAPSFSTVNGHHELVPSNQLLSDVDMENAKKEVEMLRTENLKVKRSNR